MRRCPALVLTPLALVLAVDSGACDEPRAVALPAGVQAEWDLARASRETSATRERICINGLWRFQPAGERAGGPPSGSWGYFKVPGCWPGITSDLQKDCQTVFAHPAWKDARLGDLTAAWYEREVVVPGAWAGRRVALSLEYVNSLAVVCIDGKEAGEVRFPAGEVDLTPLCRPGEKHLLGLHVVSLPLRAVMASFGDTAAPGEVRGAVARRGLCGDAYLEGSPAGPRLESLRVETSVADGRIGVEARLEGLEPRERYVVLARVMDRGREVLELRSAPFRGADAKDGRIAFGEAWRPERLWDLHTPGNVFAIAATLHAAGPDGVPGKVLDAGYPSTFGFRELRIQGRDFFLNGTRVFLSALPIDNAEVGAAWASYEAAKETLLRLRGFGINLVYTHNYGCEPGTHLSFAEVLRAADDVGMLVSLSQPHFGQYDWKAPDADQKNGYARHAEFYTHVAGNHPSVVFYSMSHNATGYADDMNPDLMDGATDARDTWSRNNARLALRAEAIVSRLDPGRIVYHHSSGNLGSMHTSNFYTNFAPLQELDDWFEGWAARGKKPVFTCEYMVPCTWDWSMYRGWYKGVRSFGSARVPWDYSVAEWSAQYIGDRAYEIGEPEKRNIRWEAKQYRDGKLWHRWDYPVQVGSTVFDVQHEIIAAYLESNWRAFRTWGVSANSPWEHHFFWTLQGGVDRRRKDLEVDWEQLQRPGFSADYLDERMERWDLAYGREDWVPTADGRAILRNNGPVLAYLAGKPEAFTSKDHVFTPGEEIAKQLIVINNSRETVSCDCRWSLGLPEPAAGSASVAVPTGEDRRIPLRFRLPAGLVPGTYALAASARFSSGETQEDRLTIHVVPDPAKRGLEPRAAGSRLALFDPVGETRSLLEGMSLPFDAVDAGSDLAPYRVLVVGKRALTRDGPAPEVRRVRDGLRVLVFEQSAEVLERRFGFRVAEYGLRRVFRRVPDHPLLAGLDAEHLRDWRGAATLLAPRLEYTLSPRLNQVPAVKWCDLEVSHVWRCGNRGNVASVLIEKPARGDFLPVLEGGYSLQYSPLLVCREGKGLVIFCQVDVTGRTEPDPAAVRLARNLLDYAVTSPPQARPPESRVALAGGGPAARAHLEDAGLAVTELAAAAPAQGQVLVLAPGAAASPPASASAVAAFVKGGGRVLALGLGETEANALLPLRVTTKRAEHIASRFEPPEAGSLLAGVGPADVHDRDPQELPLLTGGADIIGDGVLATARDASVVFCQLVPHEVSRARGALPSLEVSDGEAAEGRRSALVTVGAVAGQGARLGQKVAGGSPGKNYTLAALARGAGGPVTVRLEVDRSNAQGERLAASSVVTVPAEEWKEVHLDFTIDQPSAGGWFVCASCAQEGARLRLDVFRLLDGERNLLANPGFEEGVQPWTFDVHEMQNVRRTFRRASFLLTRLLANLGAAGETPLLERFAKPVAGGEKRWLSGFYLDQPEEWDDPYRFFRW